MKREEDPEKDQAGRFRRKENLSDRQTDTGISGSGFTFIRIVMEV